MDTQSDYTEQQLQSLTNELDALQLKYDTRLLAAFLTGRAAMLHAILINGKVSSQEEAQKVWDTAGEIIENPPERETKIVKMYDGEILEPEQIN